MWQYWSRIVLVNIHTAQIHSFVGERVHLRYDEVSRDCKAMYVR